MGNTEIKFHEAQRGLSLSDTSKRGYAPIRTGKHVTVAPTVKKKKRKPLGGFERAEKLNKREYNTDCMSAFDKAFITEQVRHLIPHKFASKKAKRKALNEALRELKIRK